jgi:hypothetical protein
VTGLSRRMVLLKARGGIRWSGRETQSETGKKIEHQIGEGERKRGRHGVQPNGSWVAGTRAEAGRGTGALEGGQGGGHLGRKSPILQVSAVRLQGIDTGGATAGGIKRPARLGPEADISDSSCASD